MLLNFKKDNKPRRTLCQKCGAVLIEGEGNLDKGVNFIQKCPSCVYVQLVEDGMSMDQMISSDVIHNEGRGYALGITLNIKGLPQDIQMVIPESDLRGILKKIDEDKNGK